MYLNLSGLTTYTTSRDITTIISLGANCQTRYHLQLHSKRKYGKDLSVSYFFDWVWRQGPIDGTISWLEQRLDLTATTWGLQALGDAWEVKANEYGSLFPHDFAFTSNNRETCEAEMQVQMRNFLAKYAFLRNRTFKAIRASNNLALLCNTAISKEHYERLEKLIVKRFGKNEFTIFSFPDHKIVSGQ